MNYIFAIGIDKYQNCNDLANPIDDLTKIIDILTGKYNFESNNVTFLKNDQATRENIINQLSTYTSLLDEDNLVILFAGHGEYDEKIDLGFLLTYETVPLNKSSYLEYTSVFNYLKAIKTKHTLLISDSCYAGSLFNARKPNSDIANTKLYDFPSRWALTSGRVEPVSDGIPGQNSPFAESLINLLETNKEKSINLRDIISGITTQVASVNEQIPRGEPLQINGHKGGMMVFYKKDEEKQSGAESNPLNELETIFEDYKNLIQKIELANNEGRSATADNLKEELEYIEYAIDTKIRYGVNKKRNHGDYKKLTELDFITTDALKIIEKIMQVDKDMWAAVKNQQYEKAADIRDEKTILSHSLTEEIGQVRMDKVEWLPEDLDFLILYISFIIDYSGRSVLKESIENIEHSLFNLLKIKLMSDYGIYRKYKTATLWEKEILNLKEVLVY